MNPTSTRLCLVRHCETDWNAERRIQGQNNTPLNQVGIAQAAAASRALSSTPFSAIYSSDLLRAQHTAETIAAAQHTAVITQVSLRERHYGIFQGLTYAEAEARCPDVRTQVAPGTPY